MTRLEFDVLGKPEPAGSKRAFPIRRKERGGWVATGRVAVVDDNPRVKSWQNDVMVAACEAMHGAGFELWTAPVGMALDFRLRRPKGHFGSGRNVGLVKPGAPIYPCVKPDATKLVRAVEDALTGIVWRDDTQVVEQFATKCYAESPGVHVAVWTL